MPYELLHREKAGCKLKDVTAFFSQDKTEHQLGCGENGVKQQHIGVCYTLGLSQEINFSGPVWQQNITRANASLEVKSLCNSHSGRKIVAQLYPKY